MMIISINSSATGAITAENVDLSNCDREIIHIPGQIQPHGVMLVLDDRTLCIAQASANAQELLGVAAAAVISRPLCEALPASQAEQVLLAIAAAGAQLDGGPIRLLQLQRPAAGGQFDVFAHRAGAMLILELECCHPAPKPGAGGFADLAACAGRLSAALSLQQFLDVAVVEVQRFTGFDRVMAYQFAEDGSGRVIAEACRAGLTAFLGLHFPASDIPAPARRMFALSWLRHLPNVQYDPVPLVPHGADPVDMSRAILRHVSVMYSSYLKNMRAQATLVMPLMKAGRLWGLISCMHHAGPLHVPNDSRVAIEILAHLVSLQMADVEDRDSAAYRGRMDGAISEIMSQVSRDADYQSALCNGPVTLQGWLDASGAALVAEERISLFGSTPDEAEVRGLATWLAAGSDAPRVFATDRLAELYPAADGFRTSTAGLLSARLLWSRLEFFMWFRPAQDREVSWAGDPAKPVQIDVVDGEARLSPRMSFENWKGLVRGRSSPWLEWEIQAAGNLRQQVADVALVRLNADLHQSNAELDSIAYAASHDLKEPLRGINNFAAFLARSAHTKLNEEERGRLDTILRLTRRMDDLIDALLAYSRISRTEILLIPVDMNDPLAQALDVLGARLAATGTAVRVPKPLPAALTDRIRIAEVFTNLIGNALKYTDRPQGERWVEIGCRNQAGRQIFYVCDNGIGLATADLERIFQIFRRLHGRSEYGGGSGAGLTIARRTVERLGGQIWAESDGPGKGATFLFTLGASAANGAETGTAK